MTLISAWDVWKRISHTDRPSVKTAPRIDNERQRRSSIARTGQLTNLITKYRWRHRLVGKIQPWYSRKHSQSLEGICGELDKLIELAADSLYKEHQIEGKYFLSAPTPTQERYQTHAENSHLSYWELNYSILFSQYSELEAHTKRLENAHLLIERSLFWKITWPLRAFRDGLQAVLSLFKKIETKDSKQQTKIENLVEDNSKRKEEVKIKEQYDGLAESNYQIFLIQKTIHFPYSDDRLYQ